MLVAGAAVIVLLTPRELAPPVDTGDLGVTAEPQRRMAVEQLALAAVRLEETLAATAGATRVLATAGVQAENDLTGGGALRGSAVRAQFRLDDAAGREALTAALERDLPGFDVRVAPIETPLHDVLGMFAGPVDIAFSGPDLAVLRRAVETFAGVVADRGDLGRVAAAPREPERRIQLDLDHRALGALGLSTAEVAEQVGYATRGETVAHLRIADHALPVAVRQPPERAAPGDLALDRIPIAPPRGPAGDEEGETRERPAPVPLGALVTEEAAAEIARRGHRRVLTVGVEPAGVPRAVLEDRLSRALARLDLPPEVSARVRTRRADAAEALASLRWVLLVSLVLVMLCLSAEFESVRLALVVLLAARGPAPGRPAAARQRGVAAPAGDAGRVPHLLQLVPGRRRPGGLRPGSGRAFDRSGRVVATATDAGREPDAGGDGGGGRGHQRYGLITGAVVSERVSPGGGRGRSQLPIRRGEESDT